MKRWLKRLLAVCTSLIGLFLAIQLTVHWFGARQERAWSQPAKPWDGARVGLPGSAAELFNPTSIWQARLRFTAQEWEGIRPSSIPAVPNLFSGGRLVLRNPQASRSGLSGAVGIEFNWTAGTLEFAGKTYPNVAVRYRGNGTYLNSRFGPKQSFKVDLNKNAKGQKIADVDELNFLNAIVDDSYLRDTLAEELFRDLDLPAPRTSYAYLTLDAPGSFDNQPLGLYVIVENIDGAFARERFGTKKTPIFKPVTYELFHYLGDDWQSYAPIYDLKTEATPEQLQRVIDLARLVSRAEDDEFATRLGDFIDLELFAAFVAGHVLLSACDGFLANGQNFYMYLDPRSNKFGFIPWDHDHSFGEFGYVANADKRERMSIWEPYLYDFLFLRRAMRAEAFRTVYRAALEQALAEHFVEARLRARIDELAALLRPAVAAENEFRLKRFDRAVGDQRVKSRDGVPEGPRSPVRPLKQFLRNRIESVRAQLDGRDTGEVLRWHRR